jgi:hypothetical protein
MPRRVRLDVAGVSRRPRRAGRTRNTPASLGVIVERIGPPLAKVPWSPELVAQNLEILPVTLGDGRLHWFKPVHAQSLRVGLPRDAEPGAFVLEVIGWYPLRPRVVHSTSWRYEAGRILLTYVVVVEPTSDLPPGSLEAVEVERVGLDRGPSMAPPGSIRLEAVLEHALRHLSWLIRDDPAIAAALTGWSGVLDGYRPEPFRSLA